MANNTSNNSNYTARPRPLSPHLQVYKPQFTSMLSIAHRASIVALFFGLVGFAAILADYSYIEHCPLANWLKNDSTGQILAKIVLSGYALAASYWVCATIRHLVWDTGRGFFITTAYKTAVISIVTTLILTALIIYFGIL